MTTTQRDLARPALTAALAWLDAHGFTHIPGGDDAATALRAQLTAALAAPAYHVPGPYEIALTVGAALASSNRFETPGAAMAAAWMAVPEYYAARDLYLTELAPALFGMSPPEGKKP